MMLILGRAPGAASPSCQTLRLGNSYQRGRCFTARTARRVCRAQGGGKGDLQLVERSEQADGSTLFTFGTATEAEEAKKKQKPQQAPKAESAPQSSASKNGKPAASEPAQASGSSNSKSEPPNNTAEPSASSPAPSSSAGSDINFRILKVNDLRELCKERQISGYSKLKRQELIEALEGSAAG